MNQIPMLYEESSHLIQNRLLLLDSFSAKDEVIENIEFQLEQIGRSYGIFISTLLFGVFVLIISTYGFYGTLRDILSGFHKENLIFAIFLLISTISGFGLSILFLYGAITGYMYYVSPRATLRNYNRLIKKGDIVVGRVRKIEWETPNKIHYQFTLSGQNPESIQGIYLTYKEIPFKTGDHIYILASGKISMVM